MNNKQDKEVKPRKFLLCASLYGGFSIFGPILVFVVLGHFLDKYFQTGRIFLFSGLAIAFVVTNILLYRKAMELTREMIKLSPPQTGDDKELIYKK